MVHWETIKFCRVLNNFEFINWIEISFSFYYFILSKLTFYKIKYLGWNTFDFLNYSFLLFFFVWVDLVKETEEKPHRGQSFIVKRGEARVCYHTWAEDWWLESPADAKRVSTLAFLIILPRYGEGWEEERGKLSAVKH